MPKITVLPKSIAELIAAGEVVERPASAVKELCENALDANASRVIVELQRGGLGLIRVTDDGCGIAREDVRNAFLRNATSKVRTVEELYAIATLGFRGEALPSIAAMSRMELLTRTPAEIAGTRYVIEGGEEKALEDAGCPAGTTVLVRDLFYNTPARQKFMKSNRTEGSAASVAVEKLALSRPEIAFRLIRDGVEEFSTMGDGDLSHCVRRVLGKDFADGLIPVALESSPLAVSGLVSRPDAPRGTRTGQNVFINGRYVRSRTVSAALEEAFAGFIMTGRYPACVLYLSVPFAAIDVNVHPSKLEVRFAQERPVYDLVYSAVRSALEQNRAFPQMRAATPAQQYAAALRLQQSLPPQEAAQLIASQMGKNEQTRFGAGASGSATVSRPTEGSRSGAAFSRQIDIPRRPAPEEPNLPPYPGQAPSAAPDVPASPSSEMGSPESPMTPPEAVYDPFPNAPLPEQAPPPPGGAFVPAPPENVSAGGTSPEDAASEIPEAPSAPEVLPVRLIGEVFGTYMLAERGNSLLLIDKHAAHERLLYEQLKVEDRRACRQVLLSPVVLHCTRADYETLSGALDTLEQLGFLAEDFGGQTLLIREIPGILADEDIEGMVMEIAQKLRLGSRSPMTGRLDDLLHSVACRAAVKAHDRSFGPELLVLLQELLANPALQNCPHGRPIYLEMTRSALEKQFGRLG